MANDRGFIFSNGEGGSGNIVITSEREINFGQSTIFAESNGISGNIILNAGTTITTGCLTATGAVHGGNVKLSAKGDILTSTIRSFSNVDGGNISIVSTEGSINTAGGSLYGGVSYISANGYGANGKGGAVTMRAYGDIVTNSIYADSRSLALASGDIKLTSETGKIDTNDQAILAFGGAITLKAAKDILAGDISARALTDKNVILNGGAITLSTTDGDIHAGLITSAASTGNAGNVKISASGDILTKAIRSNVSAGSGKGGNITLDGKNITAESLRADSVGADGGQIRLTADKFIQVTGSTSVNGTDYSIFTDSKDVDPSPNDTGARSAKIVISHSRKVLDGTVTPFIIGDSSNNGTARSISDGIADFLVNAGFTHQVYGDNFILNDIRITRPLGIVADLSSAFGLPSGTLVKKNTVWQAIENMLPFISFNVGDIYNKAASLALDIPKQKLLNLDLLSIGKQNIVKSDLDKYYGYLLVNMALYGIITPSNQDHFLAQVIIESDSFGLVAELGKGGGRHGDFYGRGLIQITEEDSYREFGIFLNLGDAFIKNPSLVETDRLAVLSAIWYWTSSYKSGIIKSDTKGAYTTFGQIANSTKLTPVEKVKYITDVINYGTDSLQTRIDIYNKLAGLRG